MRNACRACRDKALALLAQDPRHRSRSDQFRHGNRFCFRLRPAHRAGPEVLVAKERLLGCGPAQDRVFSPACLKNGTAGPDNVTGNDSEAVHHRLTGERQPDHFFVGIFVGRLRRGCRNPCFSARFRLMFEGHPLRQPARKSWIANGIPPLAVHLVADGNTSGDTGGYTCEQAGIFLDGLTMRLLFGAECPAHLCCVSGKIRSSARSEQKKFDYQQPWLLV
jgi:hypothetical protein